MLKTRLIAVLLILDGKVVQSVRFKHTNIIHYDPIHAIEAFNHWAVDEIVILNVSRDPASLPDFADAVAKVSRACFIPVAAGGWIQAETDGDRLLRSGADKLVLNSAFHGRPELVQRLAHRYGRQCIVASIDVKRIDGAPPQVVVDRGRQPIDADPVAWAVRAAELGAGEILFNSIDHDGARKGYDLETIGAIAAAVDIPVIAFGGVLQWSHLVEGLKVGAAACAAANIFHYTEQSTKKAKLYLAQAGIPVRSEGRFGG